MRRPRDESGEGWSGNMVLLGLCLLGYKKWNLDRKDCSFFFLDSWTHDWSLYV